MSTAFNWDDAELEHLLHAKDGPVGRDLQRRALAVETGQKRLLSMHGTGRAYTRGSIRHQASSPGRPPAPDTGRLRATIGHRVEVDGDELRADVGSGVGNVPGVKYAEYLEHGTRDMDPRPFLRPSVRYAT